MTLRIALWGTGLVGRAAGQKVLEHPDLELVACHAFTRGKIGKDVGELLNIESTGIKATGRIEDRNQSRSALES